MIPQARRATGAILIFPREPGSLKRVSVFRQVPRHAELHTGGKYRENEQILSRGQTLWEPQCLIDTMLNVASDQEMDVEGWVQVQARDDMHVAGLVVQACKSAGEGL